MIDSRTLLKDLKGQVRTLEMDLRDRADDRDLPFRADLEVEHQAARDARRTSATYASWLEERITQSAVAWVLGTVFLRFCEDNGLLGDQRFLGGKGDGVETARRAQSVYSDRQRWATDRDWVEQGFAALSVSPVARKLFDRQHNPMFKVTPSHQAAKALIGFWRLEKEPGAPVHDFTSEDWDTRFLGDLYQDLSEHARKSYSLLQTPDFITEFILDLTLDPAIEEFGYKELRCIDPTCGSGHFLLGAFKRLLAVWDEKSPGVDRTDRIAAALRSVHGVDKNPFAAAITRFRLLIAAMWEDRLETGNQLLASAPNFDINVAAGDALLNGRGAPGGQVDLFTETATLATEDLGDYVQRCDILGFGSYHAVFGNPPYITVKDKQENENYRAYSSASGNYSLTVPFIERFFQLAVQGHHPTKPAGFVGQIAGNAFMKRAFGKKLCEDFLGRSVRLTTIVDTSGAYIPGHGAPTVIMFGRNEHPRSGSSIRVIRGKKGEPDVPENPARGHVWTAILRQLHGPGNESDWVAVADLPATRLEHHPWTLTVGSAGILMEILAEGSPLSAWTDRIGHVGLSGADDVFLGSTNLFSNRLAIDLQYLRATISGEQVRDWRVVEDGCGLIIRDRHGYVNELNKDEPAMRWLWRFRTLLRERIHFGLRSFHDSDKSWYAWHSMVGTKISSIAAPRIAYSYIATSPHFAFIREGTVALRTAPALWFSNEENEQTVVGVLGVLNSSSACFWLKQVSQAKGGAVADRGFQDETWELHFEYSAANLGKFPMPEYLPVVETERMHNLGQELNACEPSAVLRYGVNGLDAACARFQRTRSRMIALQEELDWQIYEFYGLLDHDSAAELIAKDDDVPELKPGERAFEIVLARRMTAGEVQTEWFNRHGSTPITEIPTHWPEVYKQVIEKRIAAIETRPDIGLIERPEYKRRWLQEPWDKREKAALRNWLLDRCEDRSLWFETDEFGRYQPRPMTIDTLAERLRQDSDVHSVAQRYAGGDVNLADLLAELIEPEHVPYLAALRYKDSGLRKWQQWERTWDLQREEDTTGKTFNIPVPPKYTSADFRKPSYWSNRGKLDTPRQRFISYPGAGAEDLPGRRPKPNSLILGWAGWDYREQAQALVQLIEQRAVVDGWSSEQLQPLLAGLAELIPWVKQWHSDVDPEFGLSPYEQFQTYLNEKLHIYNLTLDQLRAWRPEPPKRGRPRKVVEDR